MALHEDHPQRREQTEAEHASVRGVERLAKQQTDGHAGKRGLAERGAEKRHPSRDDEMAQASEHRRQDQHTEESTNEKWILEVARKRAASRQLADPVIERRHAFLQPEVPAGTRSRMLAVARTSATGPSATMRRSRTVTRSAMRCT